MRIIKILSIFVVMGIVAVASGIIPVTDDTDYVDRVDMNDSMTELVFNDTRFEASGNYSTKNLSADPRGMIDLSRSLKEEENYRMENMDDIRPIE